MPVIVTFAVMIRCAITWIEFAYRHEMFIHMVVMNMMQVAIVQIVGVAIVPNSHMSTLGAVGVSMSDVLFACGFHGELTSVVNQANQSIRGYKGR